MRKGCKFDVVLCSGGACQIVVVPAGHSTSMVELGHHSVRVGQKFMT